MKMLRVRAKIDHTDAASAMPRTAGEIFDMPEERARLKAEQGFVEIESEQPSEETDDATEGTPITTDTGTVVTAKDVDEMPTERQSRPRGGGKAKLKGR